MAFDEENIPGVYAPTHPPVDLSDQNLSESKKPTKKMTFAILPNELELEPIEPISTENNKHKHSKLSRAIKKDITAYQTIDIETRRSNITRADLEADDIVPDLPDQEEEPNCCNIKHDVEEKFKNPRRRAIFMAKTMFIMCAYMIPAIGYTFTVLLIQWIHNALSDEWGLYLTISCVMWFGIHIVGWQIRSFRICIIILICRSIALANVVVAITMATERLMIEISFDDDYHPKKQYLGGGKTTMNPNEKINFTAPSKNLRFLEQYKHTEPYLWFFVLSLMFLIWITMALVLLINKKVDPGGSWIYGIGAIFVVPSLISSLIMFGSFGYGIGPKLWDFTQIIITVLIAEFESLWIPLRWKRIFDGTSFYVTEEDYVYTALWLAL